MPPPCAAARSGGADAAGAGEARAQIQRALEVLGGEQRVRAIATVEVQGDGGGVPRRGSAGLEPGQAHPAPSTGRRSSPISRSERVSHEYRTGRHDGSTRWRRFIYAGGDRAWVEFTSRTASWAPHPRAAEDRRELFRRIPHYILLEAWDNPGRAQACFRTPRRATAAGTSSRT